MSVHDRSSSRPLDVGDPVAAGIDAAVAEAVELLSIDGIDGLNISGLGSSEGELVAATVKAAVGREVRDRGLRGG